MEGLNQANNVKKISECDFDYSFKNGHYSQNCFF